MRKWTWLLAALAVLSVACGPNADNNDGVGSKPGDFPAPAPHATVWDNRPAEGNVPTDIQGPPVVNGDAGPQNDSHFVIYQLHFVAKRQVGGHVEFVDQNGHTIGPVDVPANSKVVAGNGNGWAGSWEHIERAHLGIPMGFTWFPIASDAWAMCGMIYNGEPVDYQIVQGGPCAVGWTLPNKLPTPRNPGKP